MLPNMAESKNVCRDFVLQPAILDALTDYGLGKPSEGKFACC